jgi:hypothetical protein
LKKRNKDIEKGLESLGHRLGKGVAQAFSKEGDKKGSEIGKRAGRALVHKVEHVARVLDKEEVTKEEELGIGGKIGIGAGIVAKHVVEKRGGFLEEMGGDLVTQGRTTGAKAEKLVKRSIKTGLARLMGRKKKQG